MNSAEQFEAVVSNYYEPLFRFAMTLTRTESDARDLTQHTFLVWARKGHELRDIAKAKSWLFTTLHRAFLETRRRQIRFPHDELEAAGEQLPAVTQDLVRHLDSANVLSAMANVDEIFRAAIGLFYLEDYSYKQIAAILEIPIGTVRSRIARGIAQLRKTLLSDGSSISMSTPDTTAPKPSTAQLDTPTSLSRAHKPVNRKVQTPSYDEWDSSSTLLAAAVAV